MWPMTTAATEPSHPIHNTPTTTDAIARPFGRRDGRTKTGAIGCVAPAAGVTSSVSDSSSAHQRAA